MRRVGWEFSVSGGWETLVVGLNSSIGFIKLLKLLDITQICTWNSPIKFARSCGLLPLVSGKCARKAHVLVPLFLFHFLLAWLSYFEIWFCFGLIFAPGKNAYTIHSHMLVAIVNGRVGHYVKIIKLFWGQLLKNIKSQKKIAPGLIHVFGGQFCELFSTRPVYGW